MRGQCRKIVSPAFCAASTSDRALAVGEDGAIPPAELSARANPSDILVRRSRVQFVLSLTILANSLFDVSAALLPQAAAWGLGLALCRRAIHIVEAAGPGGRFWILLYQREYLLFHIVRVDLFLHNIKMVRRSFLCCLSCQNGTPCPAAFSAGGFACDVHTVQRCLLTSSFLTARIMAYLFPFPWSCASSLHSQAAADAATFAPLAIGRR